MPISDKWSWSRPALRAQLRVGTVLETYDCGYIRVDAITDEGIVSCGSQWSWAELTRLECIIYEQPDAPRAAAEAPTMRLIQERGGRISAADLRPATSTSTARMDADRAHDIAIIGALTAQSSTHSEQIRLGVHASDGRASSGDEYVLRDTDGLLRPLQPSEALRRAVEEHRAFTGKCQPRTWDELDLTVIGCGGADRRSEVQFAYR